MKKEKQKKVNQKPNNVQGDTLFRPQNQDQHPFLYLPIKDPFQKKEHSKLLKQELYRVIKIK